METVVKLKYKNMDTGFANKKTDTIEVTTVTKHAALLALIPSDVLEMMRSYLGPQGFKNITSKLRSPLANFLTLLPETILPLLTSVEEIEWNLEHVKVFSDYLLNIEEAEIQTFSLNNVSGSIEFQNNYLRIDIDRSIEIRDERTEQQRLSERNNLEFFDVSQFVHYFHLIEAILRDPNTKDLVIKEFISLEYAESGHEVQEIEKLLMLICRDSFLNYFKGLYPNPDILLVDAYCRSTFIPRFRSLFYTIRYQLPNNSNPRLANIRAEKLKTSLSNEASIPLRYIRTFEIIDKINKLILPKLPQIEKST